MRDFPPFITYSNGVRSYWKIMQRMTYRTVWRNIWKQETKVVFKKPWLDMEIWEIEIDFSVRWYINSNNLGRCWNSKISRKFEWEISIHHQKLKIMYVLFETVIHSEIFLKIRYVLLDTITRIVCIKLLVLDYYLWYYNHIHQVQNEMHSSAVVFLKIWCVLLDTISRIVCIKLLLVLDYY